jgi:hypothetical protein
MATLSPSGSNFAMLSCSGKSCVAVDSSDTITACWGTPSYGVESCTTGTFTAVPTGVPQPGGVYSSTPPARARRRRDDVSDGKWCLPRPGCRR